MLRRGFIVGSVTLVIVLLSSPAAFGQEYPSKPIHLVTSAAGGGNDFVARLITPGLTNALGQPVIVENRASTVIALQTAQKAPPDGYTLLVQGTSFWLEPLVRKTSYDPVNDFSPIALLVSSPSVLVVHPSVPVHSVKQLIALAKSKPGQLNYAIQAIGGSTHLSGELFKSMAGINIVAIPYKGGNLALSDLISGRVELTFESGSVVMPYVKKSKLNALGVTTSQPSALLPGVPSIAESLPGYLSASMAAIWAPAKTSAAIINRLNQEIVRVLNNAEIKQKFFSAGSDTVGSSPEELTTLIRSDMTRMGKVIKEAGIKAD